MLPAPVDHLNRSTAVDDTTDPQHTAAAQQHSTAVQFLHSHIAECIGALSPSGYADIRCQFTQASGNSRSDDCLDRAASTILGSAGVNDRITFSSSDRDVLLNFESSKPLEPDHRAGGHYGVSDARPMLVHTSGAHQHHKKDSQDTEGIGACFKDGVQSAIDPDLNVALEGLLGCHRSDLGVDGNGSSCEELKATESQISDGQTLQAFFDDSDEVPVSLQLRYNVGAHAGRGEPQAPTFFRFSCSSIFASCSYRHITIYKISCV